MKSKKKYLKKKKLTKKDKIKLKKKIKNHFTKKIQQLYKKLLKFNKSKKSKKFTQFGGDTPDLPTQGSGITSQTKKFLQYSGTGNVAPDDRSGAALRAAETIGEAAAMLAVDIPTLSAQAGIKTALGPVVPCLASAPGVKDIAGSMACTLFEGVSTNMIENGVAGESTGASPQQTLSQNSHVT